MQPISTIDELEAAIAQMALNGVQISFGASASPLRKGQWFANTGVGETSRQVRGPSLRDAMNALLGLTEAVDVITEPVRATAPAASPVLPASTNLLDLLG